MNTHLNELKKNFLDLFFPKFCLGCRKEGTYLCDDCRSLLDISEFDWCLCSTKPLPILAGAENGKCQICKDKKLSGLFSALPYKENNLSKKLIYQFKYEPYLKDLAKTLASVVAEHLFLSGKNTNEIWEQGVLVPVPLDKKKLKNRGYNQSEELAKELSKILKIPFAADILAKTKQTKPQMELSKEEREKNLLGAFEIKLPVKCPIGHFTGRKIFLVDDVYTTGSTMEECARVLRDAGAKSVFGIVIARESFT